MSGVADSAIGAILEISPKALQDIEKAEKAIKSLAVTSLNAANSVRTHWDKIAVDGLQTFIDKIKVAKEAMKELGTVNVTLNTSAAVKAGEQLSTQMKQTSADVSKAVQTMASSWDSLSKVSLAGFDITKYGNNLTEVMATLTKLKQNLKNEPVGSSNNQAMADEIRQIEEWIRLYKQAAQEKNKALATAQQKQQDKTDKAYLDEQKRLLERILQLRKDISNISTQVQRGSITGKNDMSAELAQLEQLRKELRETGLAYRDLRTFKSQGLSEDAKAQALNQSDKARTDGLRQELDARKKLNEAITRGNELTAQGQQGKTRLGSGEEAANQRQLNSDYKGMIKILREQGEIKAKAAEQGRNLTQQEINLIASLAQRYKVLYDDVQRVSGAYVKMGEAAAKNFAADRSEQLARNAIMLADANKRAADAIDAQKTQNAKQAESDLNKLYTERLRLLKEKEQLENKDLLNTAKGQQVTLTQKEVQLLGEITNKLQQNQASIDAIGSTYAGLAAKAKHAFAFDELRQATQLQNQFNKAIDSIDASKAKQLTAEYKRLYAENERIQKSLNQYNGTQITGSNATAAATANNALSAQQAANLQRMADIERQNIQEVNNFRVQATTATNQRLLSEFIQAEAQKTAIAKQESANRIQIYQSHLNTYQGAMAAANKLGTRGGNYEDTYGNRARVIQNLENAIKSLNKADSDYAAKLSDLIKKLNELKNAQQEVNNVMNAKPATTAADAQKAVNIANQTKTLKEYENAYRKLLEVLKQTPQGTAFDRMNAQAKQMKANIDSINAKLKTFRNESKNSHNVVQNLQNRIAAAFSIRAIAGFLKHVTEVRAQFELQRVALGAILQDQDEANKVFTKVQQMALQSPFTIMQLEKATKQIAAFGFEAQELEPTLKMLADLSAGLGVEIDRLVLVMGHMKARNYLEGTMVRQFTNAGFNVLGELSKYYTEIEGRMVSVAEVQERVKKKMVEFGDVEEVLKRVTSAGGMFYDMQRKQSESIYGQMQRITDAYDLMLNEIGKDNEGMIKWALSAVRGLINGWRTFAPVLKTVGAMMTAIFAFKGARAFAITMTQIANAFKLVKGQAYAAAAAANTAKISLSATGIGAAVVILGIIASVLWGCKEAAEALGKEMARIGKESQEGLNDSLLQFKNLTEVITDSSKLYTDRAEAMDEMKRMYGDILPSYALEMDYLIGLNGQYGELTDTITRYYQQKEYEKKKDAVMESDETKAVKEELNRLLKKMNENGDLGTIYSSGLIASFADSVTEKLVSRELANTAEALANEFSRYFGENINLEPYMSAISGKLDIHDVVNKFNKVDEALGNIAITAGTAATAQEAVQENFRFDDAIRQLDELQAREKRLHEIIDSTTELMLSKAADMYGDRWEELKQGWKEADGFLATADFIAWQILEQNTVNQLLNLNDDLNELFNPSELQADLEEYNKELANVQTQIEATKQAISSDMERQASTLISERITQLKTEAKKYWEIIQAMRELELQGKENSKEYQDLAGKAETAGESVENLADSMGIELTKAAISSQKTTYELEVALNNVATNALHNAMKNTDKFFLLVGDGLNRIKNVLTNESTKLWFQGGLGWRHIMAVLRSDVNKSFSDSASLYSQRLIEIANKYGANIVKLNKVINLDKTAEENGKALRAYAKELTKEVNAYESLSGVAAENYLKYHSLSKQQIELYKKDAKAANEMADELLGKENEHSKSPRRSTSGEDPVKKLWENRADAVERFYQAAEKNRQYYQEAITYDTQKKSFEDLWKQLGLDQIKGLSLNELLEKGFDPKAIQGDLVDALKILEKVIPPVYTDLIQKVREKIASETNEIGYKEIESGLKDMEKFYDELFDLYELTKTMNEIGVPAELVRVIGKEVTTLDDVRNVINDWGQYKDIMSTKELEEYEKYAEKLRQIEQKNSIERLKNYTKYFLESLDERTQIEIKAMRDIHKIRQDLTLDQFSKDQAIAQRRKEMQEELAEYDFDQFKGSDVYLTVFKDLERASKEQLQYVIKKLKELQAVNKDLSPTQVKAMAQEIKKAEEALSKQTAIQDLISNLKTAITYMKQRNELLRQQISLQIQIDNRQKQLTDEEKTFDKLVQERDSIADKSSDIWKEANDAVEQQQMKLTLIRDNLKTLGHFLSTVTNKIGKGENAVSMISAAFQKIKAYADETVSHLDGIIEGFEKMGMLSDETKDTWESITEGYSAMNDIAEGGINAISGYLSGDYAKMGNGILQGIKGTVNFIAAIVGMGDKAKQRKIEKLKEKVEELEKAYEKLEKAMEEAYTFDDYNAGYNKAHQNLEKQKKDYEEMLALEESKKKKDKEAVKEYQDQLDEIAEKEKELRKERLEAQGSTSDYLAAAEDYVSAWLDAYKETGNGIDALKEHWDEFIENLFVKQAAAQLVSTRLKGVIDMINTAIDNEATDFDLAAVVNEAREKWAKEAAVLEPLLEQLFGAYGLGNNGEYVLSDLQQGIQNITEPQAAAIEAYLNSMRFAVYRHTEQLDTLIATVAAQYGANAENPVVNELKGIRGVLDSIDRRLGSVIDSRGNKSVIRVA